ncbi:MAG TPA: hypothetical protein VK213_10180 [Bacteroidales bacterium]|nr:hypothetical protein [Bacteroidales bacterium]
MRKQGLIVFVLLASITFGCRQNPVPKPRGYFRIDFPEKSFRQFDTASKYLPFSFEYPSYGHISFSDQYQNESGWFNIEFPRFGAKLYLTYKDINNDFPALMEQTYRMNIKNHITKADAIDEVPFVNEQNKVYGMLYDLKGNTATAVQFYATDSTRHYLRGSLYFSAEPDADSLAPVIEFFRSDILRIMETLKWKM